FEGDTVTYNATVAPVTAGFPTPTGTVSFTDTFNGITTSLGSASVDASTGAASLTPSATLSSGTHTITAQYSGDGSFYAASQAQLAQFVFPKPVRMRVRRIAPRGIVTTHSSITIVVTLFDAN